MGHPSLRARLRAAELQAKVAAAQAQKANYVIVAILRQSGGGFNLVPDTLKELDAHLKTGQLGWTLEGTEPGGAQLTIVDPNANKVTITREPAE